MGICESNESQAAEPMPAMAIAKKPTGPMTVYGNYLSSDFRTIMIMVSLAETKNVVKEIHHLAGDNATDEYLAVNPVGLVPTITQDGNTIFGNTSVFINYLNESESVRLPAKYKFKSDKEEDVQNTISWLMNILQPSVNNIVQLIVSPHTEEKEDKKPD
eukprot:CAMPEP_0116886100 /NCGR_PEP_ID=MMETSP0463-20121206/19788_1 /TAXON_ID=181622 /ORGANISM="Strombidinopsis sp, Strain SopsisLIS2011" /LENGTH=158 /DNA_ID=CAMNT_0004545859 /DNA_START=23 /DNA_END=499 /DNA_ORIENTATION=-